MSTYFERQAARDRRFLREQERAKATRDDYGAILLALVRHIERRPHIASDLAREMPASWPMALEAAKRFEDARDAAHCPHCENGIVRAIGRDNEEIITDCDTPETARR